MGGGSSGDSKISFSVNCQSIYPMQRNGDLLSTPQPIFTAQVFAFEKQRAINAMVLRRTTTTDVESIENAYE